METTPLFDMLRTAERFGQNPIQFVKQWKRLTPAMVHTLLWYGALREMQDAGSRVTV